MKGLFSRVYLGLAMVLLVGLAAVTLLRPPPPNLPGPLSGISRQELSERVRAAEHPGVVARQLSEEVGREVLLVPLGPPPRERRRLALLAVLTLLGVGAVGFALIRPVERQLQQIARAAERIGAGEIDARAEVVRQDAAGQLATSFNGMADRVSEMLERRDSLVHGVSHELRTPLARLRFAFELIELAADETDRRQRIQEAAADVDELESLVRELLQHSKLQGVRRGNVTTEVTALKPVLDGLVDDARRLRPAIELTLVERGEIDQVAVDRKLFSRAVGNLINNAMRYADSEVQVTLTQRDRTLLVLVDDDGPGVSVEDRERIFDPFSRLDAARSRDTGGTGLGLPIAAGAARAHGGRIGVDDSPLGGARFSWEIPL